jgi:hypothetical protein
VCWCPSLGNAMASVVLSPCNVGRMECGALAVLFPAFDGAVVGILGSHLHFGLPQWLRGWAHAQGHCPRVKHFPSKASRLHGIIGKVRGTLATCSLHSANSATWLPKAQVG